jgi:branched-chain amino acid transport system permease protein
MGQFLSALLSGLSTGVPLFLIASGLTLIFGVMGILNFAHGGFFMLGAFVAVSAASWFGGGSGGWTLFGAVVVAAVAIAAVAVVCDLVVFRRLQKREEIIGLLGTFALLLLLVGVAEQVWGVTPRSLTMPTVLAKEVDLGPASITAYDAMLIVIGLLVAVGLWFLLRRTDFGRKARAVAYDRAMAAALGIRASLVGTGVVALGGLLAGLAGGLVAPSVSVDAGLSLSFVVPCFAIVLIGGAGSIAGALVAAVILGVAQSLVVNYAPGFFGYATYVVIGVLLLLRAWIRNLRPAEEREQVA